MINKNDSLQPHDLPQESKSHWYLAASKPRQESRAIEHLINQGIEAFSPMMSVEKIRSGKKVIIEEAMFSGYLFIKLSPEEGLWHKVRSTRGIRDWVRFAGNVAKVPKTLVDKLIEAEQSSDSKSIKKRFIEGDTVKILSGPFEGLKGIFLSQSGEQRAMLLVEFLGQSNRLELADAQIGRED